MGLRQARTWLTARRAGSQRAGRAEIRENERRSHWPKNWPVGSPVARLKWILIALVVGMLAVAGWCTALRAPAPAIPAPAAGGLTHGGSLVASVRSEPASYNRYVAAGHTAATDFLTLLTQARLVRVNRATDELEPALAEKWSVSTDGQTYTIALRPGISFSDGAPFTSADVLFSF